MKLLNTAVIGTAYVALVAQSVIAAPMMGLLNTTQFNAVLPIATPASTPPSTLPYCPWSECTYLTDWVVGWNQYDANCT
jgi:hypothetical protein